MEPLTVLREICGPPRPICPRRWCRDFSSDCKVTGKSKEMLPLTVSASKAALIYWVVLQRSVMPPLVVSALTPAAIFVSSSVMPPLVVSSSRSPEAFSR